MVTVGDPSPMFPIVFLLVLFPPKEHHVNSYIPKTNHPEGKSNSKYL